MNYLCVTKCVYAFTFAVIYCSGTVLFSPRCFLLFIYCYYVFFRIKWVINCIKVPGRERIISHYGRHARRKIKFRGRWRRRFYANIMCDWLSAAELGATRLLLSSEFIIWKSTYHTTLVFWFNSFFPSYYSVLFYNLMYNINPIL